MKKCEKCGMSSDTDFCPECGGAIIEFEEQEASNQERGFCTKCGQRLSLGQKFCPKCGTKIEKKSLLKEAKKITTIANKDAILDKVKEVKETFNKEDLKNGIAFEKVKKDISRNKKKYVILSCIIVILIIALVFGIGSCNSKSNYYSPSGTTESTIESLVPNFLYEHLMDSKFSSQTGQYDLGSTTYNVGTITKVSETRYEVKGTFSLYDKYGSISYYNENFEMEIDLEGSTYCRTFLGFGYY